MMQAVAVIGLIVLAGVLNGVHPQAVSGPGSYQDPHCPGRSVIVQLFEWKWTDVAQECQRFLGPKGFCGVQVSPPNEHVLMASPPAPWYERYQPVSYLLNSRSGTQAEFLDMVKRCSAEGVRIYVDAVFNNMAGAGEFGIGSAGSNFDSDFYAFDGVPYTRDDFHQRSQCLSSDGHVNDFNNPDEVRNCSYMGWTDLDQSQPRVREKVVEYLNHLTQLGVAGFRFALAKFMWPQDLKVIQSQLNDLPEGGRPFIIQHVEDYGNDSVHTSEYTDLGYVTEFRYGQYLADAITDDLSSLLGLEKQGQGVTPSDHALVFVDNHETQRKQEAGIKQLSFQKPKLYSMATAFTLAYDYGKVRVMSSYNFSSPDAGPPSYANLSTKDVLIRANGSCGGDWVCEHRWPAISNMVRFRNEILHTDINHRHAQSDFLAFSRGDVGFFAMTSSDEKQMVVSTGLAPGHYCEVISQCGRTVTVRDDGSVYLDMDGEVNPVVAILSDWKVEEMVTISPPLLPSEEINASLFQGDTETFIQPTATYFSNTGSGWISTEIHLESSESLDMLIHASSCKDVHCSYSMASALSWQSQDAGKFSLWSDFGNEHFSISGLTDASEMKHSMHSEFERSQDHWMSGRQTRMSFSEMSMSGFTVSDASEIRYSISSEFERSKDQWMASNFHQTDMPFSERPTPAFSVIYASEMKYSISSDLESSKNHWISSHVHQTEMLSGGMSRHVSTLYSSQQPASESWAVNIFPTSTLSSEASYTVISSSVVPGVSLAVPTEVTSAPTTITATTAESSSFKRTVILMHWETHGEYVFFRGGRHSRFECDAVQNPCLIPIREHNEGSTSHLAAYNAWRSGDRYLDWKGAESGQGTFQGKRAEGSPGIWTTNLPNHREYNAFNRFGEHYWLLDVDMDCSETNEGWFEFVGYSTSSGWERGTFDHTCSGLGAQTAPTYPSDSNFARCGYVNVFHRGGPCEIRTFEEIHASESNNFPPVVG